VTAHSSVSYLIPLPVVLCLLGAGLCLVLGHNARAQRLISMIALSAVVIIAAVLLAVADRDGPQVVNIGGWPSRLGIVLVADRLSTLLLLVSAVVALCVLVYSVGQGIIEFGRDTRSRRTGAPGRRHTEPVFWGTSLVVIAMKSFAGFAGYLHSVHVHWGLAAAVTAAAVVGSLAGGRLAGRIPEAALRKAFGWFVVAMGVFVLARQLPGDLRANPLLWTAVGVVAAAAGAFAVIRARRRAPARAASPQPRPAAGRLSAP